MPKTPPPTLGMRHVALFIEAVNYAATLAFYRDILGMKIEWQPDAENTFLTNGNDNLALHSVESSTPKEKDRVHRLDHIGFIIDSPSAVDTWYAFMCDKQVAIAQDPKTHRDGAHSFYVRDPDGTLIQMIYHPPISDRD